MSNIKSTTDYSQFKMMTGNREVDNNHVARLKAEMLQDAGLLETAPILVNEHMYIVDGQHRFAAAKDLGLPIFYTIKEGITIATARRMNVTQKRWTVMDFAKSFSEGGNKDYQQFINVVGKFGYIAPAIIMKFLAGGQKSNLSEDFRRGTFTIDDYEKAVEWLERVEFVRQKTGVYVNTPLAMALHQLFAGEDRGADEFDWDKFAKKLENSTAAELLQTHPTIRNTLRNIEDVYNFHSPVRARLY